MLIDAHVGRSHKDNNREDALSEEDAEKHLKAAITFGYAV
jgi:hypothetical protein